MSVTNAHSLRIPVRVERYLPGPSGVQVSMPLDREIPASLISSTTFLEQLGIELKSDRVHVTLSLGPEDRTLTHLGIVQNFIQNCYRALDWSE